MKTIQNRMLPLALAGLLLTGGAAFAAGGDGAADAADAAAIGKTKVTLAQAIGAAEQQTSGRAFSAEITRDHGTQFEVAVATPQGIRTVMVDAASGQVASSHAGAPSDADQD